MNKINCLFKTALIALFYTFCFLFCVVADDSDDIVKVGKNETVSHFLKEEELTQISKDLQINIPNEDMSLIEKQDFLFNEIVKTISQGKWSEIKESSKLFVKLRNSFGESIFTHLIRKNEVHALETICFDREKLMDMVIYDRLMRDDKNYVHVAIQHGNVEALKILLSNGLGFINLKNNYGKTPVHTAIESGETKVLIDLIACGSYVIIPYTFSYKTGEKQDKVPLPIMTGCFSEPIINTDIIIDTSPLVLSVIYDNAEAFDIIAGGFGVFLKKELVKCVGNLLHVAVAAGKHEMRWHILINYSDFAEQIINNTNEFGETPLMLAARLGDLESISMLYRHGAELERRDPKGRTAMFYATHARQIKAIDFLRWLGADLRAKDVSFKMASHLVKDVTDREGQDIFNYFKKFIFADKKELPNLSFEPPQNLVFQGGGIRRRSIAYVRAVRELEKTRYVERINDGEVEKNLMEAIERVAGTSAGAIMATLVALGYSADDMENILPLDMTVGNFISSKMVERIKTLFSMYIDVLKPNLLGFLKEFFDIDDMEKIGLCDASVFRNWIEDIIKEKTAIDNCTFGELRDKIDQGESFKHLHIFGTKVGDNPEIVHFSSEDDNWKNLIISDAVTVSMTIPLLFKPQKLWYKSYGRRHTQSDQMYIDGGLIYNFPLRIFDREKYFYNKDLSHYQREAEVFNRKTLGLQVVSRKDSNQEIAFMEIIDVLIQKKIPHDKNRVIYIDDLGIDFDTSDNRREELIRSGENGVKEFMTTKQKRFEKLIEDTKGEQL